MKRRRLLLAVAVCGVATLGVYRYGRSLWVPIVHKLTGKRTVGGAVARFGDRADTSLRPLFEKAGLTYVPERVAFVGFKAERRLELWGRDDGAWTFVMGLGGDIFIHGNDVSVGCLAMGDDVAEQLFVLASRVGTENVRIVIAPRDFRRNPVPSPSATAPRWLPELYASIGSELENFPAPVTRWLLRG